MNNIKNCEVEVAARIISDDRIIVRNVIESDGSRKGLVVLLPGEFSFRLGSAEEILIVEGELTAQLGENESFRKFVAGDSFVAPADDLFGMKVDHPVQYLVTYE